MRHEHRAIAAAAASRTGCPGTAGRTPAGHGAAARGLLEAPALGLVAPVRPGTGDGVLNDAVGHVSASKWPGPAGTSVFAGHDVTWFSGIDRLRRGDEIRYVTPCRTYTYQVTAHRIAPAGYPIFNTAIATIVLYTCYPLDALYLTSTRYLVYGTLIRTAPTAPARAPAPGPGPGSPPVTVRAPRALAAQGLHLDQNAGPLGTFRLAGSPSPAWRETGAPLQAEAAALTAYFGVLHSAEQGRRAWWADLAPSVPPRAAAGLWDGGITGYDARISVTLRVRGDLTLGATLSTVITTGGSARPGIYRLTVAETVRGGDLAVSGFTMRSAR